MSGFLQKANLSFVRTNKDHEKVRQKAFWYHHSGFACWQFTVGSGLQLIEVFGSHWRGGGDLVLFSSDKLQGELEEKQAVNSEEQCGIELCSADRPNPSAAGMSCGPQLHEWSRLCEIH